MLVIVALIVAQGLFVRSEQRMWKENTCGAAAAFCQPAAEISAALAFGELI